MFVATGGFLLTEVGKNSPEILLQRAFILKGTIRLDCYFLSDYCHSEVKQIGGNGSSLCFI